MFLKAGASGKNWSLRTKMLVILSILILVSVSLTAVFSFNQYSADSLSRSNELTTQIIEQLGINIDTYMDELFRLCLLPYYNKNVMALLETDPVTEEEKLNKLREIEDYLAEVMTIPRKDIFHVYIITDRVYSSVKTPHGMDLSGDVTNSAWYKKALAAKEPVFLPVEQNTGGLNMFSIVQRLQSTQDSRKILGVIKVDANYVGIKRICDKVQLKKDGAIFIVDSAKNVIYENSSLNKAVQKPELFEAALKSGANTFSLTLSGRQYAVNLQPLQATDWKIVVVNSMDELNRTAVATRNTAFLFAFICAAFAVLALYVFIKSFLKPLFHVVVLMKKVQEGDLNVQVAVRTRDEVGYLGLVFNSMTGRIRDMLEQNTRLVKEVYEAKYLQKEAQYAALYNQIKPHFLFNTLNTINLLIKYGDTEKAGRAVEMLALLFRGMINIEKEIPLSMEVKLLEAYLGLQIFRRGDELKCEVDISKEFMDYIIPALILQPVVENAVVHGFEGKRGQTLIRIYSTTEEGCLCLHVADNGKGMDEQSLNALREKLESDAGALSDISNPFSESVGLLNVHRRIRLKFGEEYGLSVDSAPGEGTHVILWLPL
jgi:two-component system sensor histidine kinase YesM